MLEVFCHTLLPTCPRCGDAALVWVHHRYHRVQGGHCEECGLTVNVQYDDNEVSKLDGDRKKVWLL